MPRSKLPDVLRRVGEISEEYGLLVANVFHAGDGNLHPCIVFDERQPGQTERVIEAGGKILEVCVDAGGVLTGEHGVGLEKKAYMPLMFSDADMDAMLQLKETFAPKGLFNPGKMFPDGVSCLDTRQQAAVSRTGAGAWA